MKILVDAKNAIQKYGKNGDNSFECFGITVENGTISESKVYRYYKSRNGEIIDWDDDVSKNIRNAIMHIEKDGIIKFREISKKMVDNTKQYKCYFSINRNISFQQHFDATEAFFREIGLTIDNYCIRSLEKCISKHLSPNRSPLIMLGIEVNDKNLTKIKAYLTLEKFSYYSEPIGEKLFFDELEDTISDISDVFFLSPKNRNILIEVGSFCTLHKYYPFLVGINQSIEQLEHKVYFRIKYNGLRNEEIYFESIDLIKSLYKHMNLGNFETILNEFYQLGLFLEGFAIGNNIKNDMVFKLYFFPLPTVKV